MRLIPRRKLINLYEFDSSIRLEEGQSPGRTSQNTMQRLMISPYQHRWYHPVNRRDHYAVPVPSLASIPYPTEAELLISSLNSRRTLGLARAARRSMLGARSRKRMQPPCKSSPKPVSDQWQTSLLKKIDILDLVVIARNANKMMTRVWTPSQVVSDRMGVTASEWQ